MAGRANGLQVIDGPFLKIRELEQLRDYAMRPRILGYDGKWALHPDQVKVINEVFTPTQEQFDRAFDILDAYEKATTEGDRKGAVMFGDEMIDEASRKMASKFVTRGERAGMSQRGIKFAAGIGGTRSCVFATDDADRDLVVETLLAARPAVRMASRRRRGFGRGGGCFSPRGISTSPERLVASSLSTTGQDACCGAGCSAAMRRTVGSTRKGSGAAVSRFPLVLPATVGLTWVACATRTGRIANALSPQFGSGRVAAHLLMCVELWIAIWARQRRLEAVHNRDDRR